MRRAGSPLPVKTIAWIVGGSAGAIVLVALIVAGGKAVVSKFREIANRVDVTTPSGPAAPAPANDPFGPEAAEAMPAERPADTRPEAQQPAPDLPAAKSPEAKPGSTDTARSATGAVADAIMRQLNTPTDVFRYFVDLATRKRFEDMYDLHDRNTRDYFDQHAAAAGFTSGRQYLGVTMGLYMGDGTVERDLDVEESYQGDRCTLTLSQLRRGRGQTVRVQAAAMEMVREGNTWKIVPADLQALLKTAERERQDRRRQEMEAQLPTETIPVVEVQSRVESQDEFQCVAMSTDGSYAVCGTEDGRAYLFDVSGRRFRRITVGSGPDGGQSEVDAMAVSCDGTRIAASIDGPDSRTELWDPNTGKVLARLSDDTSDVLCFSPKGDYLAAADSLRLEVFEARTGSRKGRTQLKGVIEHVSFSPDAAWIAVGLADATFMVCRLSDGEEILQRKLPGIFDVRVGFSPDGKQLLTGLRQGNLTLWDLARGETLRQADPGPNWIVCQVVLLDDGKRALTAETSHIDLWDLQRGVRTKRFRLEHHVRSMVLASHAGVAAFFPSRTTQPEYVRFWRLPE